MKSVNGEDEQTSVNKLKGTSIVCDPCLFHIIGFGTWRAKGSLDPTPSFCKDTHRH